MQGAWKCLRFSDMDQEVEFKRQREKTMVLRITILASVYTVMYIVTELVEDEASAFAYWIGFQSPAELLGTFRTILTAGNMSIILTGAISLQLKTLQWLDWEIVIISYYSFCAVVEPWACLWAVAKLYGRDPNEYWESSPYVVHNDGGSQALMVDAMLTALCLFTPVRICLIWIPIALGVASYFLSFICVGSSHPLSFLYHGVYLIVIVAFALSGAYRNEQISRGEFLSLRLVDRKSDELEMTHESHSHILHRLTDSLVYLGKDLTIVDCDSRFPAVVARSRKEMVVGCNFADFLASPEDRILFNNTLLGSHEAANMSESTGAQGMVQVHLCDRYNNRFGVYAYHAAIFGSHSGRCHTVAIVEVGERDAFSAEEENAHLITLEAQGENVMSEKTIDSASESSTQGESQNDLAIWVNVDTPDLSIEQCSVEFTVFGPILQGTGLQSLLRMNDEYRWSKFLDWLYGSLHILLESPTNNALTSFDLRRKVEICNSVHSQFVYSAECQVDIHTPMPSKWQTRGDGFVRLVFNDVRRSLKKKSRGRGQINERPQDLHFLSL